MSGELVRTDSGAIAVVTMNRPRLNALNHEMFVSFLEIFTEIAHDERISAVVIRSAVENMFSAGADLKQRSADPPPDYGSATDPLEVARTAQWAILDCPVPVIAAVGGPALGGGFVIAALCDMIVAGRNAIFGLPEVEAGVVGGSAHIRRIFSEHEMRFLMLTARRVPAEFMAERGAVQILVDNVDLDNAAMSLAAEIAAKDPLVLRHTKVAMNETEYMNVRNAYQLEQKYTALLRQRKRLLTR